MRTVDRPGDLCRHCGGNGEIETGYTSNSGEWIFEGYETCPTCHGFCMKRGTLVELDEPEEPAKPEDTGQE
jgi:DnaJ-class molecular chaperone